MPISRIRNTEMIYHLNDGDRMTIGTLKELLRIAEQEDHFPPEAELQFDNKSGAVKITSVVAV